MSTRTLVRAAAAMTLPALLAPLLPLLAQQPPTGSTTTKRFSAAEFIRSSAEEGDASAQTLIADLYADGREGLLQDYAQAVEWLRKAADQGYAPAMHKLGTMYAWGRGIPRDYVEAHKWYNLAAALMAIGPLALPQEREFTDARNALAELMTPQQLADAQKRAREWLAAFEKRQKR